MADYGLAKPVQRDMTITHRASHLLELEGSTVGIVSSTRHGNVPCTALVVELVDITTDDTAVEAPRLILHG